MKKNSQATKKIIKMILKPITFLLNRRNKFYEDLEKMDCVTLTNGGLI